MTTHQPSESGDSLTLSKIVQLPDAIAARGRYAKQNRKVGFTNGCFDFLHAGHLRSLEEARRHCDVLFVGVNSDGSVQRLKGEGRPIFCEEHRVLLLAALEIVDHVVVFNDDEPSSLIEALMPDVLVKGPPHTHTSIVGGDFVARNGGRLIVHQAFEDISTTQIVARISRPPRECVR